MDRTAPAKPRALGSAAARMAPVRELFDRLLAEDPGYSAQVAAYVDGRLEVDLWGGAHLSDRAVTGVFSATKGVAALVLAQLVEAGELDLSADVTRYWPDFALADTTPLTVRDLLSHRSGRVSVPGLTTVEEFCDSPTMAERLARTRPVWRPGTCFGYHGLTIGVFMEELHRRVAGEQLQARFDATIREPFGVDFYLGTSDAAERRFVATLPRSGGDTALPGDGLDDLASAVFGGEGVQQPPNVAAVRRAGVAAVGGVGSARGLAAAYAVSVTGVDGSPALLGPDTVAQFAEQQCWGVDRVLNVQMCFGVGFMKPQPRMDFASWRALGHDGAGGALGYADPTYGLAFGYSTQPMASPGGCDSRAIELSALVRQCLR